MFTPVEDRRIFFVRRNTSVGVVTRVMRAIVVRAVYRRNDVPISRFCVLAGLHCLNRTIVRRVVAVSRGNVPLLRARVARYFREVNFLMGRNAIAVRMRTIVARLSQASRRLGVKTNRLVNLSLVNVGRISAYFLFALYLFQFGFLLQLHFLIVLEFLILDRRGACDGRT